MLNILYPSVRMGRMISVALPIYEYTGSQELSIASCVLCDLTSIIADSTPFFKNWNQFFLAALFFPWFYKSYWQQFKSVHTVNEYIVEIVPLMIFLCIEFNRIFTSS